VAPTDATVLVEGESGAGKEVVVDGILRLSGKRRRPFVNINCSAIPESLMESELFGYTAGSFTGAAKGGKAGKFELADGGTIFLDEIGEMPLFMQAKLLRALQSGEIQKIGSDTMQKVDVRVIAATNRNLKQMVRMGSSGKTCTSASIPLRSSFRLCGSGAKTYCSWQRISCRSFRGSTEKKRACPQLCSSSFCLIPGRATCGSSKAAWSMLSLCAAAAKSG
jgi:sigma54-dependent transcription regulator